MGQSTHIKPHQVKILPNHRPSTTSAVVDLCRHIKQLLR